MNIQALSALFVAIATLAIGASVLLRDRGRKTYTTFAILCLNVALYYLTTFIAWFTGSELFRWLSLFPAAFLPVSAIRFFRAFLAEPAMGGKPRRAAVTYFWTAGWCLALLYGAFFKPIHKNIWFQAAFALYVFGGLYRCVIDLYLQYRATITRAEKARIRYLMVGGFAAITLAITDFLPRLGVAFPTIGNFFIILYLYFLSQTLFRYRLLDLNELVGRMLLLGSLVLILTVVYGLLLAWVGGETQQGLFILSTIVASFVILILVEPVRTFLENAINQWLLRERHELRYRMDGLRRELMNVIDVRDMVRRILDSLKGSRRVTDAAVYLLDDDGTGYDLFGHIGEKPVERVDVAARSPFFERLKGGPVMMEALEQELLKLEGEPDVEKDVEKLDAIAHTLEEMNASLAIPIAGAEDESAVGVMVLRDERLRNAFGLEDVEVFRMVAAQAAITLENTQVYERMKERDRLAALGEMAAGLAHEIRNPLGAIKGAAQLLVDPSGKPIKGVGQDVSDYLEIIVDEVNRLNRVVTQFLDYARPYKGEAEEVNVVDVVKKTVQLLDKQKGAGGETTIEVKHEEGLPAVRGDAEQLRQVFLNLGLNALQAMPDGGKLTITTSRRLIRRRDGTDSYVEIRFRDTGTGIPTKDLKSLFIPFYTTKERGTGLGLPISQRIVTQHGGRIEVRTQPGKGSTFYVLLPIAEETSVTTTGTISRAALTGS